MCTWLLGHRQMGALVLVISACLPELHEAGVYRGNAVGTLRLSGEDPACQDSAGAT